MKLNVPHYGQLVLTIRQGEAMSSQEMMRPKLQLGHLVKALGNKAAHGKNIAFNLGNIIFEHHF